MKRFTALATATAKKNEKSGESRWFRLLPVLNGSAQVDSLLDLYWGGPERRITGITLRIIAVNALALLVLIFGILYIGQYQSNVIRFRLDAFQNELELLAVMIAEGAESGGAANFSEEKIRTMTGKFSGITHQRIRIFDQAGNLVVDSGIAAADEQAGKPENHFESTQLLKDLARLVIMLLPSPQILPPYPSPESPRAEDHPDIAKARTAGSSLSAWQGDGSKVQLSAASILGNPDAPLGTVLVTREGRDIEEELARVWMDILKIFAMTLVLTVTMSIYLSGIIARPLKKLVRATEAVRKGQASAGDIPDLSDRHDEIGELSLALRQMTQALWERMDSIERFAADVSHELKNPLTSLRSAVETLEIAGTEEKRQKLLGIIRHDLQRLDRLITDIAAASRLEAELSREKPGNVDLEKLLIGLMDAFAVPLDRGHESGKLARGYRVETGAASIVLNVTGGEPLSTWGLESRLAQVFQNLIANALSFSPVGGAIAIMARPAGSRAVAVTIEDDGPGIPEANLETIFERFYSERPQHEAYGQHSGLGLSICKQIVTAHGGRIFAENRRGPSGETKGARFTVILNKVQAAG